MPYIGNEVGNRFVASKAASVYSGDGSTTAFTLEHAVGSDEDILVSVDGVIQEPSVAYAVSSGTTLTFTAAPSSNSGNNIFVYYLFRTVATVDHPSTSSLQATDGTFSSTLNVTGVLTGTSLDISGDIDVDGTTNLDVVDIDGAVDMASTLTVTGALSAKGGAVFNEDSADVDFRVEGNGNTHALFVEGSSDRVGIGTSSMAEPLRVQADSDTDFSASGAAFNNAIMLKNATAGAANTVSLAMATESNGEVYLSAVQNSGNDAADFVISTRDSGARAERLRVKSDGAVTMPLQPAFLATNTNANQTNFAVGALVDVNFGVEVFDQNADFASSTFTAPVAGKYQFNVNCRLDDMDSASNYYLVRLVTSNRNYTHIWDSNEFSSDTNYFSLQVSCLADMDASDTAKVIVYQNNGTQQTAVIDASYFSGHLVC
jgi:hypothetical protein